MTYENMSIDKMKKASKEAQNILYKYASDGWKILVVQNYNLSYSSLDNWLSGKTYSIYELLKIISDRPDYIFTEINDNGFLAIEQLEDKYDGTSYRLMGFALVKGQVLTSFTN